VPKTRGSAPKIADKDKRDEGTGREALTVLRQTAATAQKGPGITGSTSNAQQAGSSKWKQMASSGSSTSAQPVGGTTETPSARGRFAKEDSKGTRRAIEEEWTRGKKTKDVLSACARINEFLDNPLFARDERSAAVTVQRVVRGWLLRSARYAHVCSRMLAAVC
jgi:hypothetical protein